MQGKPSILVLSHVLPLRPRSGQEQRVAYTLAALRARFRVTFATNAPPECERDLAEFCDEVVLLPPARSSLERAWNRGCATAYSWATGLKRSNYLIGKVNFASGRIRQTLGSRHFDGVLFEYWHASESTRVFSARGIPCILDMHNVLWQAYERQLCSSRMPDWWKSWAARQYRKQEEASWNRFQGVIAINHAELEHVRTVAAPGVAMFYAPMGLDLSRWPYTWSPASPPRIGYYGGLASPHNRAQALTCACEIMPRIWREHPDAEFWIAGSNPPPALEALAAADPRIRVTGYMENPGAVLASLSTVLCPWMGTYGFRSRLIEIMACGAPLVAYPDAFFGMDLKAGRDLLAATSPDDMAACVLRLLRNPEEARALSRRARKTVESGFAFEHTYGRLAAELEEYLTAPAGAFKERGQCA